MTEEVEVVEEEHPEAEAEAVVEACLVSAPERIKIPCTMIYGLCTLCMNCP